MNKYDHIKQVFFKQDFHEWTKENHVFYMKNYNQYWGYQYYFGRGTKWGKVS